jgi:exosortase N
VLVINRLNANFYSGRSLRMAFWIILYVCICLPKLQAYINPASSVFWSGLCCLLYLLINDNSGEKSKRFAFVAVFFTLLSFAAPVKTAVYLSCGAAILFLFESAFGKINFASCIVLIVMSPVFEYATTIFSFPLRLEITEIAGSLLQLGSQGIEVHGNTISSSANEFSVDPECMGLYMLEVSILIGVMMSSVYAMKFRRRITFAGYLLMLATILLLNLVANLFRIIMLVQFRILPSSILHELIGLACLLVYIILPAGFLIRKLVKSGQPVTLNPGQKEYAVSPWWNVALIVALFVCVSQVNNSGEQGVLVELPAKDGYQSRRLESGVFQLNSSARLVYIKPIKNFYSIEHNPMICWQGSGYVFQEIAVGNSTGRDIYFSTLERGKDRLFTAWWYESGKTRTISQAEWRRDALFNAEAYALVNITCATRQELDAAIREW